MWRLFGIEIRQERGLKSGSGVTQAERFLTCFYLLLNTLIKNPAWSVCANSRTQTQARQPIVSAEPLRFRESERT